MAVKYLSGNRIWGTDAERLALAELNPDISVSGTGNTYTKVGNYGVAKFIDDGNLIASEISTSTCFLVSKNSESKISLSNNVSSVTDTD